MPLITAEVQTVRGRLDLTAQDVGPITSELFREIEEELDFAVVVGLTQTAKAGERAVEANLGDHFQVRRGEFLRSGLLTIPATKANPEAQIIARDDFLARHELGGIKRPRSGRALAIPQDELGAPGGIIGASFRPRAVLAKPGVFRTTLPRPGAPLEVIARQVRKGKGGGQRLRVLYVFAPEAKIEPTGFFREPIREVLASPGFFESVRRQIRSSLEGRNA